MLALTVLVGSPAAAQITRWDEGWVARPATLRAGASHLIADPAGQVSRGPTDGFGIWETFTLYNTSHADRAPRLGDIVLVAAHTGRFLTPSARAEADEVRDAGYFMVAPRSGAFTVGAGLPSGGVALRLVGRPDPYQDPIADGTTLNMDGRSALTLNSAGRLISGASATALSIDQFTPELVRVSGMNGRWAASEGGGGGAVTVNRTTPGTWESHVLYNVGRPGQPLRRFDVVALQTYNGKRWSMPNVSSVAAAEGTQLRATSNRTDAAARFLITSFFPAADGARWVQLRPLSITQGGLRLEGDRMVYRSSAAGSSGWLVISPAQANPAHFNFLSSGPDLPSERPFATAPTPVTKTLLTAAILENLPGVPFALTPAQAMAMVTRTTGPSVANYLSANTGGAVSLVSRGTFGPAGVPQLSPTPSQTLAAAASSRSLAPLADSAGFISSNRVLIFRMNSFAPGGQFQPFGAPASAGGVSMCCSWVWVGATTPTGSIGIAAHEASHALWGQTDNYGFPESLHGDGTVYGSPVNGPSFAWGPPSAPTTNLPASARLIFERLAGDGALQHGDRVRIRLAATNRYAHVDPETTIISSAPNFPSVVQLGGTIASSGTALTLEKVSGSSGALIRSGDLVRLIVGTNRWSDPLLGVPYGRQNGILARRPWQWQTSHWTHFRLDVRPGASPVSGAEALLVSDGGRGGVFEVAPNRRTPTTAINAAVLERGYVWGGLQGSGQGGQYDNADLHGNNLLSAFSRMKNGWTTMRYATPDRRGCYEISSFLPSRQAVVLFDPQRPSQWYTLELRENDSNADQVMPGVVVSWVADDDDYWTDWFERRRDPDLGMRNSIFPVVISAVRPGLAPNNLARSASLFPNDDRALSSGTFTNEEDVVLPLGDGAPSRFRLSFSYVGGGSATVCVL